MSVLFSLFLALSLFVGIPTAEAQSVAVYDVRTNGFQLNQSEVTSLQRIAMQACFDSHLTCSGRGQTKSNVLEEQGIAGSGKLAAAAYISECELVGKTEGRFNVGTKSGGIDIFGGAARKVGGTWLGGASNVALSGLRFGGDGINLSCQFTRTSDGVLAYSKTDEKIPVSGELVLMEARSSNAKKVEKAFRKMFDSFKKSASE